MQAKVQKSAKIMITGLPSLDLGSKALDLGIGAYMVKPVNAKHFLVLIEEKIKSKNSTTKSTTVSAS